MNVADWPSLPASMSDAGETLTAFGGGDRRVMRAARGGHVLADRGDDDAVVDDLVDRRRQVRADPDAVLDRHAAARPAMVRPSHSAVPCPVKKPPWPIETALVWRRDRVDDADVLRVGVADVAHRDAVVDSCCPARPACRRRPWTPPAPECSHRSTSCTRHGRACRRRARRWSRRSRAARRQPSGCRCRTRARCLPPLCVTNGPTSVPT